MKDTIVSNEDNITWPHEDLGILHGDLNISNLHYDGNEIYVFDWDQIQQGYWELDIAQACITVFMLNESGSVITCEKVPEAEHPEEFLRHFVEGYNTSCQRKVNEDRLGRMILNRKLFYKTFAEKALREEGDTIPIGMKLFLEYIMKWNNGLNLTSEDS